MSNMIERSSLIVSAENDLKNALHAVRSARIGSKDRVNSKISVKNALKKRAFARSCNQVTELVTF